MNLLVKEIRNKKEILQYIKILIERAKWLEEIRLISARKATRNESQRFKEKLEY